MRARILIALFASCLTSGCLTQGLIEAREARYEASNERNRAEALRSYLAAHRLTEVAAANRGAVGYVPDPSGGPGEHAVADGEEERSVGLEGVGAVHQTKPSVLRGDERGAGNVTAIVRRSRA